MSTAIMSRCSILYAQSKSALRSRHSSTVTSHLPRIAQPSLWSNIVPKFLRRPSREHGSSTIEKRGRLRTWLQNPSTSLVILGMLTGSQAIQVMQLRSSIEERQQMAQRRIDTLKGVLERIHNGETVDLRKELGTGDPVAEAEWKDVVDQIADEAFWLLPKPKKLEKQRTKDSGTTPYQMLDENVHEDGKSFWWSFGFSNSKQSADLCKSANDTPAPVAMQEQPVRRAFY